MDDNAWCKNKHRAWDKLLFWKYHENEKKLVSASKNITLSLNYMCIRQK